MKINRRNPEHLFALAVSAANSLLGSLVRPIARKNDNKIIIFYGHTLNGNLKSFYDYLKSHKKYKVYFLCLDKYYYQKLQNQCDNEHTILSGLNVRHMITVARADVIITSHGLHLFSILRTLTNIKFVDVWHAVSYKGFGPNEFNHLHAHDEIWVSSDAMKRLYINRYAFKSEKVKVTGYSRTDQLINGSLNRATIINKYSIPKARKYVLIAPTWKQDVPGRDLLPFGLTPERFFQDLDNVAKDNSAHIIFRTHLNSSEEINTYRLENISFMPYAKYEVVEDFLFIADILVTDWSSVAVDYLPLKRPTLFLDVEAPFKHGFNLGPEHRFGDVVSDFDDLKLLLVQYLDEPQRFKKAHGDDMERTSIEAYGSSLDGMSTNRYYERLERLLR